MRKTNIICDLDGTLALDEHRGKKYLKQPCTTCLPIVSTSCPTCGGKGTFHDWESYFAACDLDPVNDAIRRILYRMDGDHDIHILTGRSDVVKEKTQAWLKRHIIPYQSLIMRPASNRIDDHILKPQLAAAHGLTAGNTLFVLEDRQRVVDAWRQAGYVCLQVAPGAF